MPSLDDLKKLAYVLKDSAMNHYSQGEPYRKALASALQGDLSPADKLFNTPQPVNPNEAVDAAMAFSPMGMGIVKNVGMNNLAKEHYGVTNRPLETGYILDDGTRLDLSGRHEATGYNRVNNMNVPESGLDYFKNERGVDHRSVHEIQPNGQYGWDSLANFIDQTGAVRYMPETGVSMVHTNKPSQTQIQKIVNDFNIAGNPLLVDIDHMKNGDNIASKEFTKPNFNDVNAWIDSQYKNFK